MSPVQFHLAQFQRCGQHRHAHRLGLNFSEASGDPSLPDASTVSAGRRLGRNVGPAMVISASALSLKVADERASAQFARDHVGFVEEMAHARMWAEGVLSTTPIETEPWGERYFQVSDPNGVVYQFVQWMTAEQVSD